MAHDDAPRGRPPLEGVRVLDASRVLAGPYCTYLLGLLGATVVRIERPGGDTIRHRSRANADLGRLGLATDYLAQACNKDVLHLDLATAAGREAFLLQVSEADVLVENFRTGSLDRLGLSETVVREANPALLWCSITAYGRQGPRARDPAYDSVVQAASGLMQLTGTPASGPLKAGAPVVDYVTGLNAAFAVVSALIARSRERRAARVEVSMLESALVLMHSTVCGHLNGSEQLTARGNAASSGNALSSAYRALDGTVCIAVNEPHQRAALLRALGLVAPATDGAALSEQVRAVVGTATAESWERSLNAAGVPCARVRGLDEAVELARVADKDYVRPVPADAGRRLSVTALPFRLDGWRGDLRNGPRPLEPAEAEASRGRS